MEFIEKYRGLGMKPKNNCDDIDNGYYDGYYWSFEVNKIEFFNKTKEVIRPYIKNYVNIYNILPCV